MSEEIKMDFESPKGTSRILGLSERYVRTDIKLGRVPCIYSGRKCLINIPQYRAILAERAKSGITTAD